MVRHGDLCRLSFPDESFDLVIHADEVRSSVQADGSIVHHLPAVYPGNPVDSEGALAYRTYGWSLLRTLREAGFDTAEVGVLADPDLGFTSSNGPAAGYMEAIVFRA